MTAKSAFAATRTSEPVRKRRLLALLVCVAIVALLFQLMWKARLRENIGRMSTSDLQIAARQQPRDAETHLALADRYLWEERNEDALREARRATQLASNSSRAFYLLGKACQRGGSAPQAIQALQRAVALDPGDPQARFLLGHGLYWHDQPLPAIKQFEQYVEQQPADDIGFRFLGLANLRVGNLPAAEAALGRAVALGPDSSGNHQALGNFYLNRAAGKQDMERAAAELLKATEINPSADGNRVQAAVALERLGRQAEAARQFEVVFAKSPTDEKVCYSLLQIYTRLQDARRMALYGRLYKRIVRAREAKSEITASAPGTPSYPTR